VIAGSRTARSLVATTLHLKMESEMNCILLMAALVLEVGVRAWRCGNA
jgi:hypothetical protein